MSLKSLSFKIPHKELKTLNIDHILTPKQIEAKNKRIGKGIGSLLLTLTLPQILKLVKDKKEHKGGFIFTTALAILSAIGALAGGAAAITNAVHNKSKNDAELEEQKRHNLAIEAKSDPPNIVVGSSIRSRKRKSTKKVPTRQKT